MSPQYRRQDLVAPVINSKLVLDDGQCHPCPNSTNVPPRTFVSLPADIHHLIITDYLPFDSAVALRSTSPHFRFIISPLALKHRRQKIVSDLMAQERALRQKWLPKIGGAVWAGPSRHITCYSCLQYLPITDFFRSQVSNSRSLGRKRASKRWCKLCGMRDGKIRHGTWYHEVSYGCHDQDRYWAVMHEELNVRNLCARCSVAHCCALPIWWGCVDCADSEKERLRSWPASQQRAFRHRCSKVTHGIKSFLQPENVSGSRQEAQRKMSLVFWGSWLSRLYHIDWRAAQRIMRKEMRRGRNTIGHGLDRRQMKERGAKMGKKFKTALGSVIDLSRNSENRRSKGGNGTGGRSDNDSSFVPHQDCIICNALATGPDKSSSSHATYQQQQQQQHHHHHHVFPPRRSTLCLRCWQKGQPRSRRRREGQFYIDFIKGAITVHAPLPKERWCDGCVAEHDLVMAVKKAQKQWRKTGGHRTIQERWMEDKRKWSSGGDNLQGKKWRGGYDAELMVGLDGIFD